MMYFINLNQLARVLASIDLFNGLWNLDEKKKICNCSAEKCLMCHKCIDVCKVLFYFY